VAVLTDEQVMLKDMASAWLRERMPVAEARALYDGTGGARRNGAATWHDHHYAEMAAMGWTGILVPQAHGGLEFGYRSMGLVLEECGRTLAATPLHSSALVAASALVLGGSAVQQARWLPAIADGSLVATLAADEGPRHDPLAISLKAERQGDNWVLDGIKRPVADGMFAGVFIVAARTSGAAGDAAGITLFLVPAVSDGLACEALDQIDARRPGSLTFVGLELGPDALLGTPGEGAALLDQVLDRARAGLAAELLGIAEQAFETTVDYMKTRVQFDRPIGSFQALQHRVADMFGEIQLARAAVEDALDALDRASPQVPALASLAKALAGDCATMVAKQMVQLHGGIGMTHEHDAGLYLKRALAASQYYGNPAFHRDRWGRLNGY
jgi:alkylation response protein AidB-like acyl-CoA dehydrogenase